MENKDIEYMTSPEELDKKEKELKDLPLFERLNHIKDRENRPALHGLRNMKDIIGLEIGALYGVHAKHILENYDIKTLHIIDPFDLFKNNPKDLESICISYLKPYMDKIILYKGFSEDAIDIIPNDLDFIYIDGDHSYKGVIYDFIHYYHKVKKGGIFGGHDYVGSRAPYCVAAVDQMQKFVKELIQHEHWDWWLIKE